MSAIERADGLRLAIFSDTALPQMNGVSRTLGRLAHAVRARGAAVRLFTTTDPEAGHDPDVVRYASRPFWAYPQLRLAWPASALVTEELRAWAPTVVHAATPFGLGLAGRAAAAELRVPFVTSYHTSLSAYARFYRLGALAEPGWAFLRWFHNSGLRTYCPTRAIEAELVEHGFRDTAIWSRGVDTERFSPARRSTELRTRVGADRDTLVVAYVGRLAVEKGLDVALDAMHRVQAALPPGRVRFLFAGDGPYAAHCRAHAPSASVFLGQLGGDELSAVYASSDLFVFPSTTDTFGNVLLEAMASGLVVVGADVGPTREVLGPDGGVCVPAGDGAALARELLALAQDPERRTRIAGIALASARERSWDRIFDALVRDYARVQQTSVPRDWRPPLRRARTPLRARLRARVAAHRTRRHR